MERIFVGNKDLDRYLSACFYGLSNNNDEIQITGRGNNVKRSIDVAAILLRKYISDFDKLPFIDDIIKEIKEGNNENALEMLNELRKCEVKIGSEEYINEGNENNRFVSTIDIFVRGKIKNENSTNK